MFDNRRGFRVGYKVVAVVRVWDIAVWIFPVDALAFLRLCLFNCADFFLLVSRA